MLRHHYITENVKRIPAADLLQRILKNLPRVIRSNRLSTIATESEEMVRAGALISL